MAIAAASSERSIAGLIRAIVRVRALACRRAGRARIVGVYLQIQIPLAIVERKPSMIGVI